MGERVGFAAPTWGLFFPGEVMERKDDYVISEELEEWIGLKKSELLSDLILKMTPDDFGFEEFHKFDHLVPGTIEAPDKVFESSADGQILRTYVRSYDEKGRVHQVVKGVFLDEKDASVFIPILIFISRKDELVKEFAVGQVITRPTLN